MQTLTLEHITDQVVFIHLSIGCWSGRKTLQPEDLGLSRAELPPDALVSLGDKRLLDPNALKVFTSLRSAARRTCLDSGVRFLGGFLVPVSKSPALLEQLTALEQRFEAAREAFLARFDSLIEAWILAHPHWQHLFRSALVPADYVASRLRFSAQVMQLQAPKLEAGQHAGLEQAVAGLADTLFSEISQLAKETLEHSFLGRQQVTRRALRPFLTIHEKLDGLAFLDSRVRPVIDSIDQLLARLPAQGPLQGNDLAALCGFLAIAENPERLKAHGAQLAEPVLASAVAMGMTSTEAGDCTEDSRTVAEDGDSVAPEPLLATLAELVDDEVSCFF